MQSIHLHDLERKQPVKEACIISDVSQTGVGVLNLLEGGEGTGELLFQEFFRQESIFSFRNAMTKLIGWAEAHKVQIVNVRVMNVWEAAKPAPVGVL